MHRIVHWLNLERGDYRGNPAFTKKTAEFIEQLQIQLASYTTRKEGKMSVINMKYRKSLLGISNQLTRQDLDLLKFMCEQDVPKSRMERVVSGTDLFNALEERGKLSVKNLGYLADILRSIGRSNLVENYLRSDGFVIPPSSLQVLGPGGQTGSQTTLYLFRDCLVRVAQGLTSKEVNDLVFIFQPNLQISPDAVFSATQLFTLLQQRQMLTPRDMRLLYDGLCQVQRYDLASIVNEFAVKTGLRAYQGENQGGLGGGVSKALYLRGEKSK